MRSSCGAAPTFEIARSVLPDLIVPPAVTDHSVSVTVVAPAGVTEAGAETAGETDAAELGAAAEDCDASGGYVQFEVPPADVQPIVTRARPAMTNQRMPSRAPSMLRSPLIVDPDTARDGTRPQLGS